MNASALGVQWRAWGSTSVGWVLDDTRFISSFVACALTRVTASVQKRLKAWKFAARTEAMNAEQRQLFEETLAADETSLRNFSITHGGNSFRDD